METQPAALLLSSAEYKAHLNQGNFYKVKNTKAILEFFQNRKTPAAPRVSGRSSKTIYNRREFSKHQKIFWLNGFAVVVLGLRGKNPLALGVMGV